MSHLIFLAVLSIIIFQTASGASVCSNGCLEAAAPRRQETEEILGFVVGDQDFFNRDLEHESPVVDWLEDKGAPDWGRMIMLQRRHAILPWPDALIPYVAWGDKRTRRIVNETLTILQRSTCLTFKARTDETRYLIIKEGHGGCWTSSVGYPPRDKKVIINLGLGCRFPGLIMHEILHAAGFLHEHTRPDRGNYIQVKWENIREDARKNYGVDLRYSSLDIPYDYKSVMHYGRFTFSKAYRRPTLVPTFPVAGELGGASLTPLDIRRINTFYKCI
ncbi:astacin-like metalloprotease toxin 3 isoform X2 [Penaeus chinensis]|uniref:astacin-like metalloprotease toxin 3 isoform X2 n=1 Tax=Penaeus chinensis TaxID=139456 RepID=UPI001FB64891|nr:astacin-like metalloprotease toxin 3 isoform X2 [Penaeus chinensis]